MNYPAVRARRPFLHKLTRSAEHSHTLRDSGTAHGFVSANIQSIISLIECAADGGIARANLCLLAATID